MNEYLIMIKCHANLKRRSATSLSFLLKSPVLDHRINPGYLYVFESSLSTSSSEWPCAMYCVSTNNALVVDNETKQKQSSYKSPWHRCCLFLK